MSETTARHALPYIQAAQAQKYVTHNEAIEKLDLLVQLTVEAFDATLPPALPEDGHIWALGPAPSAEWEGQGGHLAAWVNGAWVFIPPRPGWRAAQGTDLRVWSGSAWHAPDLPQLQNLEGLGIQTSHDATNRLAIAAAATLLTHDGGGHQLKINKNDATDTASLLFQTGWSGRAEMGTAGSDAWALKVSADGSTWREALTADPATGLISLPHGLSVSGTVSLPADSLDLNSGTFVGQLPLARGGTGAATAAGARSNLGLGTAASATTTTSATDTTSGRLTKVGDFGLGQSLSLGNIDLDADYFGFWGNDGQSSPPVVQPDGTTGGARWAGLTVGSINARLQMAVRATGDRSLWHRARNSSVWEVWRRLYDTANLVGTVSQSGGVPTGAVIQRGSSANGQFVRFADGTQICWLTRNEDGVVFTETGNAFRSESVQWTFPAAFSAWPTFSVTGMRRSGSWHVWATPVGFNSTSATYMHIALANSTTDRTVHLVAHGRWF